MLPVSPVVSELTSSDSISKWYLVTQNLYLFQCQRVQPVHSMQLSTLISFQ